ncbi:L-threonylcarbamoyladenylate synthase [Salinispirillum marinum]|uniref:Threonylcarbamoyl-AMP synthase n=2 Tax=Saccharospirillaceae TaxID=255527 RepID=A0ABV8BFE8_9GAMM
MRQNWQQIRRAFYNGQLLAYPTEAVWGLGCDPFNEDAVRRLQAVKNRSAGKGLILAAGTWAQLEPVLAHLSEDEKKPLYETWPGPVTWLIPHPPSMPQWIMGNNDSVAVRLSAHPGVQRLTKELDSLVVSTSANHSGKEPARNALQIRRWFGRHVPVVIPGALGGQSKPSSIFDLRTGRQLR